MKLPFKYAIKQILKYFRSIPCHIIYKYRLRKMHPEIGYMTYITDNQCYITGGGNSLSIGKSCILKDCKFQIFGDNSRILIGDDCNLVNVSFFIEDSGNEIIIGKGTTVYGETHIAACEGRKIQIGEDCMFSQKIYLSTTDSHSVVTLSGERVNPAQDIKIGNHVWVGRQNTILKGSNIGNNVIVAASSLVSAHTSSEDNIVVGGTPAKVLCKERNWLRKRI